MLADLTDVAPLAAAAGECAQLHREVTDALIGRRGRRRPGRGGRSGSPRAAAAEDPLREPAALLLMRALAATGQAPEALRTGREYRHRLAEETGLDPSPALGELERDIAGGAAGPPPATVGEPRPAGDPADRPGGHGRGPAPAARRRDGWSRSSGRAGSARPGSRWRWRASSGPAPMLLLAPVTEPAAVPHALAAALHLSVVQGDVLAACLAVLADRRGLLVIDNCEHLLDAVRDTVEAVLAACPGLSVLATSREPLGLATEYTFRLAPAAAARHRGGDLAEVPVGRGLPRAGRAGSGPARHRMPAELRHGRRDRRAGSTACRWRSSWPPGGCPRSR